MGTVKSESGTVMGTVKSESGTVMGTVKSESGTPLHHGSDSLTQTESETVGTVARNRLQMVQCHDGYPSHIRPSMNLSGGDGEAARETRATFCSDFQTKGKAYCRGSANGS
ncbi:hypothetical protein Pmani_022338 [Petrolisthes manimaculis]|uniref:Uncharacterized protein n=1 Tax=Petrolisthes manimaculis TaxID=1843537 RepID=A0AAE1PE84_9EUCA|nr:hypothetical protein Pmani_022338 [Petrolisthes manimaculis]